MRTRCGRSRGGGFGGGSLFAEEQPLRHSFAVPPPSPRHPAFRRAGAKGTQGRQKAHRFYGSPFVGREAAEVRAFRQSRISRTEHRDIPKECYGAKNVRGAVRRSRRRGCPLPPSPPLYPTPFPAVYRFQLPRTPFRRQKTQKRRPGSSKLPERLPLR